MIRPAYSYYARHCAFFYAKNIHRTSFDTEIDKNNWYACHRAIGRYSDRDKDILLRVYGMRDTLADNIYEVSQIYCIDQNVIWDLLKDFERVVGEERGLVI